MKSTDYEAFKTVFQNAHAVSANGKKLNNSEMSYAFDALKDYSLEQITAALLSHTRQEIFAPTPCHIVQLLNPAKTSGPEVLALTLIASCEAENVAISIDDLARFQALLLRTGAIYSKEVSVLQADTLLQIFNKFSIDEIEKAFYQHMRENTRFPTAANIIDLIPEKRVYITMEDLE
jgi:hypothetical protein